MPDAVTSRGSAAPQRPAAGPARKPAGQPRKSAPEPPLKTKADKRAEAKARKEHAKKMARRRRLLTVYGSGLGVLVVLVGLVLWIGHLTSHHSTPAASASASAAPAAAATTATAAPAASPSLPPFPSVPAGANAALKTEPKVTKGTGTITKLKVTTLIKGKGAVVKDGQTISVNYVGVTYADGKQFDASWTRKQAFSFTIGQGDVIKGWDQGLLGVTVGSRVQLDIPAALAYGTASGSGQPTGTLRFVVDVLAAS